MHLDAHLAYRRHLPHWRAEAGVYFVTWRLHRDQGPLEPDERTLVASAIRHFDGDRYCLVAFVVMDDHVHVILQPSDGQLLEEILRTWKSFTANRMQRLFDRVGEIWQNEYFDRILRDESELHEKSEYVLNNPRKRWPGQQVYAWVWAVGTD